MVFGLGNIFVHLKDELIIVIVVNCCKCLIGHSLPLKHGKATIEFGIFGYQVKELDAVQWIWVKGLAVYTVEYVLAGLTNTYISGKV